MRYDDERNQAILRAINSGYVAAGGLVLPIANPQFPTQNSPTIRAGCPRRAAGRTSCI
jgi:hypothetical protein